ncbi:CMRF35-like molecule 6 [Microcaecilia unicolor]|uniref:CMRF35-like molecule 6 n=1 Tax=Microcaecilia unicolor TaxID=1415580 RepID=A0A6P7X5D3_9AMPH|nr:CMRF35-like molecule 6 [Microcaecilia unicolor]
MKILMRTFPVWSLMILCPGKSWDLQCPGEVRGLLGESLSLQCQYDNYYSTYNKYWCKGETWKSCIKVIETTFNNTKVMDRVSLRDDSIAMTLTVTMEQLTKEDSGMYWCGIDKPRLIDSGHLVIMTVLPGSSTLTPAVTSVTVVGESRDKWTKSEETGHNIPYSTPSGWISSVNVSYILTSEVFLLLLISAVAGVILIRTRRRKKGNS